MLLHSFWKQFEKKPHMFLLVVTGGEKRQKIERHGRSGEKRRVDVGDREQTVLVFERVTQATLLSLYRSCQAFMSVSRAEGWEMPLAESIAMQMPVTATNWSGNMEFMNINNSFLV